jgi:hypothetical protein
MKCFNLLIKRRPTNWETQLYKQKQNTMPAPVRVPGCCIPLSAVFKDSRFHQDCFYEQSAVETATLYTARNWDCE